MILGVICYWSITGKAIKVFTEILISYFFNPKNEYLSVSMQGSSNVKCKVRFDNDHFK
jgi:hypothetical protein